MLLNASSLERELLYKVPRDCHGDGECHIACAEPDKRKKSPHVWRSRNLENRHAPAIELTLRLILTNPINLLRQGCGVIIQEGGESKSERAKQAKALMLLLRI